MSKEAAGTLEAEHARKPVKAISVPVFVDPGCSGGKAQTVAHCTSVPAPTITANRHQFRRILDNDAAKLHTIRMMGDVPTKRDRPKEQR